MASPLAFCSSCSRDARTSRRSGRRRWSRSSSRRAFARGSLVSPAKRSWRSSRPFSRTRCVRSRAARQLRDREAASGAYEKPAFADGDLFSSLFEGPTSFALVPDSGSRTRSCRVRLTRRRRRHGSWTDRVVVSEQSGRPAIADIEYGGNWAFGNSGTLRLMLERELAPPVRAINDRSGRPTYLTDLALSSDSSGPRPSLNAPSSSPRAACTPLRAEWARRGRYLRHV